MGLGIRIFIPMVFIEIQLDMTDLILAQKESPFSDDYSYQLSRALSNQYKS